MLRYILDVFIESKLIQSSLSLQDTVCTSQICLGSLMAQAVKNEIRTTDEVFKQAKDFLNQYFTSIRR